MEVTQDLCFELFGYGQGDLLSCRGHRVTGSGSRAAGLKPGVASGLLHESDAEVGRTGATGVSTRAHRSGRQCHRHDPARKNRSALPTVPTRWAVFHRAGQGVNPDASLSLFAVGDSGAGARRGTDDLGACSGSAERPLYAIVAGPLARTACHSRCCPGRSGCRSPPGSDNGYS